MSKSIGLVVVLGALFAVGCGDKAAGGDASAKPADSGAAKSGDSTGIPECDEYIKNLEGCVKKVPAMEASLKTARDAYKSVPAEGKAAAATGCKQAAEGIKEACK